MKDERVQQYGYRCIAEVELAFSFINMMFDGEHVIARVYQRLKSYGYHSIINQ